MTNEKRNTIHIEAQVYSSTLTTCGDYVASYSTDLNTDFFDYADNGDFVVADFNFDSNDDYAIKIASGGSVGAPNYEFYIQKNDQFVKDDFLSSLGVFPKKINAAQKQISIEYLLDKCTMVKAIYEFDDSFNKWFILSETGDTLCN